MEFAISISAFWVAKNVTERYSMLGIWYYKDYFLPNTKEEKLAIVNDIRNNKCVILYVKGSLTQISDLLSQSDRYRDAGAAEIREFTELIDKLEKLSPTKQIFFDDINNLKGTTLSIDTLCDIDDTMDDIQKQLKAKQVSIEISKDWSLLKYL